MVRKPLLAGIAMAVACGTVWGAEGDIPKFDIKNVDPAVLEQARLATQQAEDAKGKLTAEDNAWLQRLADSTTEAATEPAQEPEADQPNPSGKHPLGEGTRTLIFVSWSMGASAIKDIMSAFDGRPATGIVFRGIPEGMKMVDAVTKMHMLTQETQSQVSVLLDPLAFQRHNVQVVPAIVLEGEDNTMLAKAAGTTSTRIVESAIEETRSPDTGTHGPTTEIIEPDLMEVAKARIEQLDVEAMKKRAIARFWDVHTGTPLPPVTKPARRLVDSSVIIPSDILDAEGNVVQKAGKINPLEVMPFNQKLVVIDPTQPWQVALAKDEYKDHGVGMTVTVMATQISPSSGWELFQSVQDAVDAPLYLLPADMAGRFQILRAPSVVTAEGLHFVVREVTKQEWEDAHEAQ